MMEIKNWKKKNEECKGNFKFEKFSQFNDSLVESRRKKESFQKALNYSQKLSVSIVKQQKESQNEHSIRNTRSWMTGNSVNIFQV